MKVRIERVSPRLVAAMLPECEGWLARAVERCKDENVDDVKAECLTGAAQLWVAYVGDELSGVFVTQICETARRRVLELRYLAGMPHRYWTEMQPALAVWAKQRGCVAIRIRGRKGWLRVLPNHGWKPTSYEMELAT
jgi:hypothetical protein